MGVLLLVVLSQTLAIDARNEEYCFTDDNSPPDLGDCWSLLNDFANPDDSTNRIFDEEQLRELNGAWPGLARPQQQLLDAIQLPRVFSRSEQCEVS